MNDEPYRIASEIELTAWRQLFEQAPPETRRGLGLSVSRIGGATALRTQAVDHPLVNRAVLDATAAASDLDALVTHYREVGLTRFFIQRPKRPTTTEHSGAGLIPYRRAWVKLAGPLTNRPATPQPIDGITIRRARPDEALACGELVCRGFDVPAPGAAIFAGMVTLPGWQSYVAATSDGTLAGVGNLFVGGEVGYLGGAVTVPAHRGRGIQRALMATRARAAHAAGCAWLTSETGEPVPGDPQHSMHNMQRFGLDVVGLTENLATSEFAWRAG